MESAKQTANGQQPHLQRRLGLIQATALNMVNMIGAGPFITIPLLLAAMGGPQALLGWFVAAIYFVMNLSILMESSLCPHCGASNTSEAAVGASCGQDYYPISAPGRS